MKQLALGHRIGISEPFLGEVAKEHLGKEIKRQRYQQDVRVRDLAASLNMQKTRALRMEDGDCSIPLELYLRALQHLGVSRKEIGDLIGGPY